MPESSRCFYEDEQDAPLINSYTFCPNHHENVSDAEYCATKGCLYHTSKKINDALVHYCPNNHILRNGSADFQCPSTECQAKSGRKDWPAVIASMSTKTSIQSFQDCLLSILTFGNRYETTKEQWSKMEEEKLQQVGSGLTALNHTLKKRYEKNFSVKLSTDYVSDTFHYDNEILYARALFASIGHSRCLKEAVPALNKRLSDLELMFASILNKYTYEFETGNYKIRQQANQGVTPRTVIRRYTVEGVRRGYKRRTEIPADCILALEHVLYTVKSLAVKLDGIKSELEVYSISYRQARYYSARIAQLPRHVITTSLGVNAIIRAVTDMVGEGLPKDTPHTGVLTPTINYTILGITCTLTLAELLRDVVFMRAVAGVDESTMPADTGRQTAEAQLLPRQPHRNQSTALNDFIGGGINSNPTLRTDPRESVAARRVREGRHRELSPTNHTSIQELTLTEDLVNSAQLTKVNKALVMLFRGFSAFSAASYSAAQMYLLCRVIEIIKAQNADARNQDDATRYIVAAISLVLVFIMKLYFFGILKPANTTPGNRACVELCETVFAGLASLLSTLPVAGLKIGESFIEHWQLQSIDDDDGPGQSSDMKKVYGKIAMYIVGLLLVAFARYRADKRIFIWAKKGLQSENSSFFNLILTTLANIMHAIMLGVPFTEQIGDEVPFPRPLVPEEPYEIKGAMWVVFTVSAAIIIMTSWYLLKTDKPK